MRSFPRLLPLRCYSHIPHEMWQNQTLDGPHSAVDSEDGGAEKPRVEKIPAGDKSGTPRGFSLVPEAYIRPPPCFARTARLALAMRALHNVPLKWRLLIGKA